MDDARFAKLTARQKDCLRLVARNYTSKEIALALNASKDAVDKSIKLAMARLGVDRRSVAGRLLADHDMRAGSHQMDPHSADLPPPDGAGMIATSPDPQETSRTVREERASFNPLLEPLVPVSPVANNASEEVKLGRTINHVLDWAARIAGIAFMILALAYLASVIVRRWEASDHVRPRQRLGFATPPGGNNDQSTYS